MGKTTNISWTEATWNAWTGCAKVSKGCKYCYMFRQKERWRQNPNQVKKSAPQTFTSPLRWKGSKKIFVCSWSDFFVEDADAWRGEAWEIIKKCPNHVFQILTKRAERIASNLPQDWGANGYPNVWLGVSVEDQAAATARLPFLLSIPASVRFASCEPLLEPLNLKPYLKGLNWIITGGESGSGSVAQQKGVKYGFRACEVDWLVDLQLQAEAAGISCFTKQMGTDIAKRYKLQQSAGANAEEWEGMINQYFSNQFPNFKFKQDFPK